MSYPDCREPVSAAAHGRGTRALANGQGRRSNGAQLLMAFAAWLRRLPHSRLVGVVFLALLWPTSASANDARLLTCVEVVAHPPLSAQLQRLLEVEVDRHPTHRAAKDQCQSYLRVELIELGHEGRFLTGRINSQVPHREAVTQGGLASAVERLVTVLLHNDPLRLSGPRQENWLERKLGALRRRSTLHFGLEFAEVGLVLDSRFETLPSVALSARREVDDFHVGLKLMGAHAFETRTPRLRLTSLIHAAFDLSWYTSESANTSAFFSLLVGLGHQRFEGPSSAIPGETAHASSSGAVGGLRAGIETLRVTDIRLALFAEFNAPTFQIRSDDDGVADAWVPWGLVGAGVSF